MKILEQKDNKLKIEVSDLTFVNLLNETMWKQTIDYAAHYRDHIYLAKPVLVVSSKNPKKTMLDAAETIIENVKELRKKVEHLSKK
mgnify:CR=1 FL=1